MRRAVPAVTALAVMLLLPATAAAKGPSKASITGPGLQHAITIDGYGEGGNSSPLGVLVDQGGFFAQAFQPTPRLTTETRPAGLLGPRYLVVYTVPGPNGESTLRQDLYPYAGGGTASYMASGQKFWNDTQSTTGGWFRGSSELRGVLVKAGLPKNGPRAKSSSHGHGFGIALGAGAGVAAAAAALGVVYRRRSESG
jgi:hypothetical protein